MRLHVDLPGDSVCEGLSLPMGPSRTDTTVVDPPFPLATRKSRSGDLVHIYTAA